jgi:hypothetical protein
MSARLANSDSANPMRPSGIPVRSDRAIASFFPGSTPALRVEPAIRFVTDSLLAHPELPKPPASPRLRPGRDFTPMPGDEVTTVRPRRALPSTVQPTRKSGIALALVAVVAGFAGGMLVAWLAGLI